MELAAEIVEPLRSICCALPEVEEQEAWVGLRWRVRGKTFAHVLTIEDGWPPAYASALGSDGPAIVLMFRSSGDELAALRNGGAPFFAPPWRADEVGLVVDATVAWDEVRELVSDSYCTLAPKRLAAAVNAARR